MRYAPEVAAKNGDVVNLHGNIANISELERFFNSFQSGKKDFVRITNYTIEGDPILQELYFNGKSIDYVNDSTRDSYAVYGTKTKTQCLKLEKDTKQKEQYKQYYLSNCSSIPGKIYLLAFPNLNFDEPAAEDKF